MQKIGLNEIREKYLSFFESKGHLRLPSFSLVPVNDTSLLLINSGMAPLKPYFIGKEVPPKKRVTTCQKCIRTPDIENVGKTARHGTFFEMLGNFSFGDYFKKEATSWAWEFITKELELPVDRLWVSIYENDDDAFDIWTNHVGVPKDRIVRMGKDDNFWEIGTGPCGPCSEIYFDLGEDRGCGKSDCKVGCDCDRYIEFWNLVFTQFNKTDDGEYKRLDHPNIDTGMGLERLACIMQGVNNLFEVDTVRNVLDAVCKRAGVSYLVDAKNDVSIRVITDHIRSTVMLISDGVLPSNEGRGYVLRRLLRRAARHGKLLGIDQLFLSGIADVVINESRDAYTQLGKNRDYIKKVIMMEEEKFHQTVEQGMLILNDYMNELEDKRERVLSGEKVFKLHDTYGFPVDLTREILQEKGLDLDEDGFEKEMQKQKEKARRGVKDKEDAAWSESIYEKLDKNIKTEFTGYTMLEDKGKIVYIVRDGELCDEAKEKDRVCVILDRTPFYAQSGGQVADVGYMRNDRVVIEVENVQKTSDGKIVHECVIEKGSVSVSDIVETCVDKDRRESTSKNHTATHLLQRALKNVLGEHVSQAGSSVDGNRLRFDFTHFAQVTKEDIELVEAEVNRKILENLSVCTEEMDIDKAKKLGATALFDEKYGDVVRVVKIGDYSMELCGGTHIASTVEAGLMKIVSQTGVAAGVRRIEAVTGEGAIKYYKDIERKIEEVAGILKTDINGSVKKAESVMEMLKENVKEVEKLKTKLLAYSIDDVIGESKLVEGIPLLVKKFDDVDANTLKSMSDLVKEKMGRVVLVFAGVKEGKIVYVASATKDLVGCGVHVGNILKEISKVTKGGGGGRPDSAQAGGIDIYKLDDALEKVDSVLIEQLKK